LWFGPIEWEAPAKYAPGLLLRHASRGAGSLARHWSECKEVFPERQITFL
jgi:hypothetical protein